MTEYTFTVGAHTAQAHEYTDVLIKEAYERDTTPDERVKKSDKLCESHFEQVGEFPDESVLNRLAWYIVFDEMTDKNEHKVSQTDYPILSDWQTKYRREREKVLANVYTGANDEVIGRYTDQTGMRRKIYDYMTPERDMSLVPTEYLDLYNAIENAGLTDRQRQAIDLVYFEGMTQEMAAEVMGVGQDVVSRHLSSAIRNLREYIAKN